MAFKKGNTEAKKKGKNKQAKEVKECILEAFHTYRSEGGKVGGTAYLQLQMIENPVAFMGMLGKILPKQIDATVETGEAFTEILRKIVK